MDPSTYCCISSIIAYAIEQLEVSHMISLNFMSNKL